VADLGYQTLHGPGYPIRANDAASRLRGDRWLQGILASELTPGCKVLSAAIVRLHFNWTTGQCNPSQDTLAAETNQCTRSVEKQLEKLREAGVLAWKKGFQSSNRYWLLLTPNCGRELGGDESEDTAEATPNHRRELNTEPTAGTESHQNRTTGRAIPNPQGRQNRTLGGRNPRLTPEENPFGGAPPRAPGGAAVAASKEVDPRLVKACGGQLHWSLKGAVVLSEQPPVVVVAKPAAANWARAHFGFELERQWGGNPVEIRVQDEKGIANAA